MASNPFGRRSLLRGLGGIAIALPALEIMTRSSVAQAAGAPLRYAYFFGGNNTMVRCANGYDGAIPLETAQYLDLCLRLIAPKNVGRNYDLAASMTPLTDLGVKDDISIVSDLKIPTGTGNSSIPAGGRYYHYHTSTLIPQTTGMRCLEWDFGSYLESQYTAPTHDQIVADLIGGSTPVRILNLCAQADSYGAGTYNNARISWRKQGGNLSRVDNVTSPQLAFQSLFTGFSGTDPAAIARAQAELKRRKSVLDLVDRSSARVLMKLGKADADRVSKHFDEIRTLEKRIAALSGADLASCKVPADPGADSAIRGNENARAEILGDLMAMAFACGLTRVATMMLTYPNSLLNVKSIIGGADNDLHNVGHKFNWVYNAGDVNSSSKSTIAFQAWQVKQFCRFVKKLKDTPDVDGKTVLDNSVVTMGFEGGYGYDPEANAGISPHSSENMCILVAGRAGGLMPGKHVKATGRNPASAMLSAMKAVGHTGALGEISTDIPELFTA